MHLFGPVRLLALFGATAISTLLAAAPTQARTPYDGRWSVVIATERGDCDRAYRYAIDIQNGQVVYAGDGSFTVNGRVSGNGSVRVSVSRGDAQAIGSGRLSARSGSGRWQGRGNSSSCAGSWTAERRG